MYSFPAPVHSARGTDLTSDTIRNATINKSIKTKQVAVTPPITTLSTKGYGINIIRFMSNNFYGYDTLLIAVIDL